jgi:uncharacterized protein YdaU (DUF1376 family)
MEGERPPSCVFTPMPKTNKPPAFLFYPDDFSSDGKVEVMTTEEVGAYILLLCKAWREEPVGSLPNDDRALAHWARLSEARWAEVRLRVLSAFLLGKDGRWYQKRMCQEYERLRSSQKKRQKVAKNAAEKRWKDNKLHARSMLGACSEHSSAFSSSSSVFKKKEEEKSRERVDPGRGESEGGGVYPASALVVQDFLNQLQCSQAYQHLNVKFVYDKFAVYCAIENKEPTRSYFLNWLNTEDSTRSAPPPPLERRDEQLNPRLDDLRLTPEEKARFR